MTKKIKEAIQVASNVVRDFIGADRCTVCNLSKSEDEMECPRLCKKCAEIRKEENQSKPKRVSRRTVEFVKHLTASQPLFEKTEKSLNKPPEPSASVQVTFPKKTWTCKASPK